MENISEEQKVLIVDDEPANIRILIENLKGRYKLIGAICGKEALECAFSDDPPDLILLDILMPDIDGYEVCARLKNNEKTRNIPVIFITVMEEDANEARGFELGAVDYITKPFSPATVNARVKTHLELKRHRDRLENSLRESAEKLSDSDRKLISESHGRIRAEQEREQLSTAVEHAAEAFIITDPEGIIQYVNPVFQECSGYSREEAAGQTLGILDSGQTCDASDTPASFYQAVRESIRKGKSLRGIFSVRRKDGTFYKAESSVSPVVDAAGRVVNLAVVSRDITREAELEARLRRAQKLEAIGTLAGGIAHDFNNIICIILGYTELGMTVLSPESEIFQYLEQIDKAGRRAADLVRQILTFGRKSDQERRPIRIQPVLKEVIKFIRGIFPSFILFRENIESECGSVLASPSEIHQIIMNLCTNAYHAMRDQGGILEITLTEISHSQVPASLPGTQISPQYVRLRVKDTGHGMDENTLSKIFDPYFTTKKIGEGTGLGLSTVYGIVREYDGVINVESLPGHGALFEIFLPVHTDIPAGASRRFAISEPTGKGMPPYGHILFADDEEQIVRMAEISLKRLGYDILAFSDSTAALDAFRKEPQRFDLLISDMTMPGMTGLRLAQEIFRIRPDLPVILCTGFNESITEDQTKNTGIRGYLKKPFAGSELEQAIVSLRSDTICKIQPCS